jgi:hypothetical protein
LEQVKADLFLFSAFFDNCIVRFVAKAIYYLFDRYARTGRN